MKSQWKELSYAKYGQRNANREMEKIISYELSYLDAVSYGLYENLYKSNTFSVEDLFDFNCEEI